MSDLISDFVRVGGSVTLDLDQLRAEADRWLMAQPANCALDPRAIEFFRTRFCLPSWLVDVLERDAAKERQ